MDTPKLPLPLRLDIPVGQPWRHRFMESADVNAAFRELFAAFRTQVRRGMANHGQVYAIEMDGCIPGELLGTEWIPTATRGIASSLDLADPARRRGLFARLLAEARPEALFAYACERRGGDGRAVLYVEIVSANGSYAAEYPIARGRGWHERDLGEAAHRRIDTATA